VNDDEKRRTFSLRFAPSLKDQAKFFADRDGISLNHFLGMAVEERIARLRASAPPSETQKKRRKRS
jgi:predicted HicB family RNase H-like nuclease